MVPTDGLTLDQVVSKHQAPLLRLAIRLTGNVELAEEIMQDTLLRVTQSWNSFRGQSGVKT
jgi:DNA-directed RNA polymerase specialized sigma24 family protein